MSAPIQEAAAALAPILAGGADAAARDLADQAGSAFARTALRVIERIRGSIRERPTSEEVQAALSAGVDDGRLSEGDLKALVDQSTSISISAGKNVYNNLNVRLDKGDWHG